MVCMEGQALDTVVLALLLKALKGAICQLDSCIIRNILGSTLTQAFLCASGDTVVKASLIVHKVNGSSIVFNGEVVVLMNLHMIN